MSFSPSSRYFTVPQRSRTGPGGDEQLFVARRIIPQQSRYETDHSIRADASERIDGVAAEEIGDPLLYWRICDANGVAEPGEATQPDGRVINIPLPLSDTGGGDA